MDEKLQAFTEEQLNSFSKNLLVQMVLSNQAQIAKLNDSIIQLTERINVLLSNQYGRKTERSSQIEGQLEFCFNEAEITIVEASSEELREPTIEDIHPGQEEAKKRKPHPKGKREPDLSALEEREISYELPEDRRICECGGSLKDIGKQTTTRLEFHPAYFEVIRQVVHSYKCTDCGKIIRADHPLPLFEGSLATPSLIAGIMTGKFVNAVPLARLEKAFADHGARILRQTQARWMIRTAEVYFSLLVDRFTEELLRSEVIHADETTAIVSRDGRPAGRKSYMWVYTKESDHHPVVIYEYQKTRAAAHVKEFLRDYKGWLCCDGYEAYHNLSSDITVCGCWAHARRHYANAEKVLKKDSSRGAELSVASEALRRIGDLFHTDKQWKDLPGEERQARRETELKPKVEEYFCWVKSKIGSVPPKSETGKGLAYSMNQKEYLLGFLTNPDVPLDNSEAERKIRNFVVARKNFILIDTIAGAEASAILFSMSETARANNLKPYDYFKYLLEELPKHMKDDHRDMRFLDDLLPWSDKLPAEIRKTIK